MPCSAAAPAAARPGAARLTAGLTRPPARHRRFGLRRHYHLPPWTDLVEVHWAEGAEAYVTPVAADLVGVAILGPAHGRYEDRLTAFPALQKRLAGAAPASEV